MGALKQVLVEKAAFAKPSNILSDIPFEVVTVRPNGLPHSLPHSLYEELWHLNYWLRFSLALVSGESPTLPAHSSEGFPSDNDALTEDVWTALLERVQDGLDVAALLAGDEVELARTFAPEKTVADELTVVAAHNAYHFGRMVTLRQLLGVWPSELGDSW